VNGPGSYTRGGDRTILKNQFRARRRCGRDGIGLLYSGFRAHEVDTPNKLSLPPSLSQALYYTILALGVWGPPVISCRPRGSSSSTFVQRVLPLHDICHASKFSNQVNRKKATYNLLSLAPRWFSRLISQKPHCSSRFIVRTSSKVPQIPRVVHHGCRGTRCESFSTANRLVNGDGTRDVKTTRPGDEAAPEQDGDGANVQLHTHEREGEEAGDDGDEILGTRQGA